MPRKAAVTPAPIANPGPRVRRAHRAVRRECRRGSKSTYDRSTTKVTSTTANTRITTTLCTTMRSRCTMGLEHQSPETRQEEDILDDDAAGQEKGELHPQQREHRHERVGQGMAPQHVPFARAFGARGADVVLAQGVEQCTTQHTGEDGRLRHGERDGPAR